jgi:hypothetical protein
MHKQFTTIGLFVVLALAVLLGSCTSASSVRIGWACFDNAQKMDCSYRKFSGRETRQERFKGGDTVAVHYDLAVESGNLTFTIVDPEDDTIFTSHNTGTSEDTHTFTAVRDGRYRFILEGSNTQGEFLIEWERTD